VGIFGDAIKWAGEFWYRKKGKAKNDAEQPESREKSRNFHETLPGQVLIKNASVNMRWLSYIGYRVFPRVLMDTGACDQVRRTINALSPSFP
jgi:hypothetical protein